MNTDKVLIEVARRLENRERFVLVTIIRATGSTPRKEGARMIVDPDGTVIGSVGGGSTERIAIDKALECLISGRTERLTLNLDNSSHRSSPLAKLGESKGGVTTGMICGGWLELLIEPFGNGPRLLLFGAGHVGRPTARLASDVDFAVMVHDSRSELFDGDHFHGSTIKIGSMEELAVGCETTADDFIVVMTYSHDEDYKIVRRLLRKPFYYLGVIGSKQKSVEIRRRLSEDGFSDDEIARMTSPIGLKIGSHTPAEIAVSVIAQLIEIRHRWETERMDNTQNPDEV